MFYFFSILWISFTNSVIGIIRKAIPVAIKILSQPIEPNPNALIKKGTLTTSDIPPVELVASLIQNRLTIHKK